MRNLIRKLALGAALLGLTALVTVSTAKVAKPDILGVLYNYIQAEWAGVAIPATDDTDVMAIVKYVGVEGTGHTAATTTMQVAANAITFLLDGAAVTTFECPITAAPLDGIIDLTDGDCDTYGELEDIINLYGYDDGWRISLINAKRSDGTVSALIVGALSVADELGQTILQTSAEAGATGATVFASSHAILTPAQREIDYYLGPAPTYYYVPEPFKGTRSVIKEAQWLTTYGAGTSGLYFDHQDFKYTDVRGTPTVSIGTEVAQYYQISGATTVSAETDFQDGSMFFPWDRKVFVRVENSNSLSVRTMVITAFQFFRGATGGIEYR